MNLNKEFSFCENSKTFRGGSGRGVMLGGHGGCERRSEVIVKIKIKSGGGVRDGGSRGGGWSRGRGWVGSNVGGGGGVGYGGCEPRIEGIVQKGSVQY